MASQLNLEVPSRRFSRYLLRSMVGAGGMAEVFRADAVDPRGGEAQTVAVKLMRKGASAEAFAGEADLMGVLEHPGLVRLLEVGQAFGRPFIAMEFLAGGDLYRAMKEQARLGCPVPPKIAVHVCLEVLRALAYFHQARSRS